LRRACAIFPNEATRGGDAGGPKPMVTILIADGQALCRDLLAAMLKKEGYSCLATGSGPEAWEWAQKEKADLLVTETELAGLAALELVERVRGREETRKVPVIILTNSHDKGHVIRGVALGIHGYFLKSQLSAERLLSRIRELIGGAEEGELAGGERMPEAAPRKNQPGAVTKDPEPAAARQSSCAPPPPLEHAGAPGNGRTGAAGIPRLLTREQTVLRLDQVAGGKTIAGVVAQVIALANSPDADMADLVRALESDPVLATRVLQAANSASAGVRMRIRTVEEGVRTLGVREIRNLALNIGIFGSFPPNQADGFNTLRCWQHSFAVAELIGLFMNEKDHYQASVQHLVGLCHDLGEILLRQHFAAEYQCILEFARAHQWPVHEVENIALGIRHPELLSRLLSRIGLPQPVVHVIREFYERQIKGQEGGMSKEARALLMANQAAHGMLLGASMQGVVGPVSRREWQALGTAAGPPAVDPVSKRNEIICTTNLLARLPQKDERVLMTPLAPRQAKRVWYVRPEAFIEMDPLGMALAMMCEVRVASAPPTGGDWNTIDGLVAVGLRVGSPPIIREELVRWREEGGRPDLPLLILAGQDVKVTRGEEETVRPYPIKLVELNEWLSSLRVRETVGAA
jgi:HD-like signal output (HDOD) protein/CheY-like chemotaxis protein